MRVALQRVPVLCRIGAFFAAGVPSFTTIVETNMSGQTWNAFLSAFFADPAQKTNRKRGCARQLLLQTLRSRSTIFSPSLEKATKENPCHDLVEKNVLLL